LSQFYGNPMIFFPIGNYKYLWSPDILDFYARIRRIIDNQLGSSKEYRDNEIEKAVRTYKNTDLQEAINLGYEISFNVKEYYLVPSSDRILDAVKNII